ncbi:hypothetical protein PCC7424_1245 [Gloeothece citriformis PCC 7424]|uniref:Uncharacterized protein n=1 Tax=Gloeothece citriformis (strain PCC 7424) TaxID=65393 RepID=B7K7C4_GLOC7|nr:hypothetical protein [Gloeothece citriformis]ACK69692.1 hypothetical protein PCC7424_1245 [Gloeothece citriformis PCC 7424]
MIYVGFPASTQPSDTINLIGKPQSDRSNTTDNLCWVSCLNPT